ncbi:MAG: hypothetical protein R3C61_16480 [Bacteroidia bacterium]
MTGSRTGKIILAAFLLLSGWVMVRSTDSFTYQTQVSIRPDSLTVFLPELPEPFRNTFQLPVQSLEKTLIYKALRNTGIRLAVHDLTARESFRPLPAHMASAEKIRIRAILAQYLEEGDTGLLADIQTQEFLLKMGYDTHSLKPHLKLKWENNGQTGILAFSSEHRLLSAFVINDLCREIARVDRDLLLANAQNEMGVIQQQLNVIADTWNPEFEEERFAMKVDGHKYWLHPHYPLLKVFNITENAQTRPVIQQIKALEISREVKLKEGYGLISESQNILKFLKKERDTYPAENYQTMARTIDMMTERLRQLGEEISTIDSQLEEKHQAIAPWYGDKTWVIIPRKHIETDSKEFAEALHSANDMVNLIFHTLPRLQQNTDQNNIRRIPNMLNLLWLTLGIVFFLHIAGTLKDKMFFLWKTEK